MKIKISTATKQCETHDHDCAPPIRCELQSGHISDHQWTGIRTVPKENSEETEEKEFTKTFRIGAPSPVPDVPLATPPMTEKARARSQRVADVINTQLETPNS